MKFIICLMVAVFVFGCGKGDGFLDLRVQFPDSLKKGGARYQRFLSQAEFLEVHVKSGGKSYENRFPPAQWEALAVPDFEISEKGVEVSVRVWDRTRDGIRRNYPVLEGKENIERRSDSCWAIAD